jgi:hypothetical protein
VWKLDPHVKGGTETEGVGEQGAEGVFVPKRDELTGGWNKLHNEKLHNLYFSSNTLRRSVQGV